MKNNKNILLLGAGMVAKPIADYLLDHGFSLSIASRTVSKAKNLIGDRKNGKAIAWTVDQSEKLDELVSENDLIVSLLPYAYHVQVAKLCIRHRKHMVTTSYVSPAMKALHEEAEEAGILILNEIGVDPGYDHMTAMRIIDKVHKEGGEILKFYSLCGALAAPETIDNPFGYKFSWSPKGVVMASNNGARYLKAGEVVDLKTEDLFKDPLKVDFPGFGELEVYPNRDSLPYIDIYQLPSIKSMFRGTFRFPHWCESLDAIKALGLTSDRTENFGNKTYRDLILEKTGSTKSEVKESIAAYLDISENSPAIQAMEWLGYLSEHKIPLETGSPFDLTCQLMMEKMMLGKDERDMVVMLHAFHIKNKDGNEEVIKAHMLDFATEEDTSIARTVALPAAIASRMILESKIQDTGVHIPIAQSIYDPILDELESLDIRMTEEWGLAPKIDF
jgi:saccharopine dehydrogenase-like NADP-dependent oxidoreductase